MALVRVAVCEVLFEIFKVCENVPPDSIKQRIQPILVELLQDKDIEVRIEAFKVLEPWSIAAEKQVLDVIKSSKITLKLDHPSWRVRKYELEAILKIASRSNKNNFHKYFREIFLLGI